MKQQLVRVLTLGAFVAFSAPAWSGDAAAGKAKSAVCAACHGANGIATIATYPSLAGQNKAYLVSAMKAYKNKQRTGGMAAVMQAQAAGLSDADIENLAEYYSSMK
ncbi:MAG: cytochrome C biogenesis protein CcsB [Oleiphilus sp.]|nr:MAG: cytochrome C biogenesis protein CcsB [Oleiphilus sp.]